MTERKRGREGGRKDSARLRAQVAAEENGACMLSFSGQQGQQERQIPERGAASVRVSKRQQQEAESLSLLNSDVAPEVRRRATSPAVPG